MYSMCMYRTDSIRFIRFDSIRLIPSNSATCIRSIDDVPKDPKNLSTKSQQNIVHRSNLSQQKIHLCFTTEIYSSTYNPYIHWMLVCYSVRGPTTYSSRLTTATKNHCSETISNRHLVNCHVNEKQ